MAANSFRACDDGRVAGLAIHSFRQAPPRVAVQRQEQGDRGQSQLTVGRKTWFCKLPKLPPILVPPPEAQIRPFTKADP